MLFRNQRLLRICLIAVVIVSCAERSVLSPPKTDLVDPTKFLKTEPAPAYSDGYSAYRAGDQRQARIAFQKALKKNPRYYPAFLGIAYTYIAEGNADFAERYVRRALDAEPDYVQAHFALASILEGRQDYEGALAELGTVQGLRPDYPGAEQNRNILRLKSVETHLSEARKLASSDPEKALEHYAKAREMAPEVNQIPMEMAQLLAQQSRCAEAIPYLQDALKESPSDAEVQLQLADCLVDQQQYEEALPLYEAVAESKPGDEIRAKLESTRKIIAFHKMPDEYQQIPHAEQVNRAQLAALLVTELPFLQKYNVAGSEIMVDILNHWAKNYIQRVVDLSIMEVFPNRTFEPQQPITRLELAKAASRLVQILSTSEEKQIPVAAENMEIPDISSTNINYPLVSTALSAGVLSLDADGRFHPGRSVSGAEVQSMVNRLKTLSE